MILTLGEPSRSYWERFVSGAHGPAEADSLAERWSRALDAGASPWGNALPACVPDDELGLRREHFEHAIGGVASFLTALAAPLTRRGYLVLVGDADGVILHSTGASAFSSYAARQRVIPGARWDEAHRGTNGIGTAIAERRPVAVLGRAHLEETNHGLVCYAAPIFDARGDVLGVVDATSAVAAADELVPIVVSSIALAIEGQARARAFEISSAAYHRGEVARSSTGRAVFLIEPPGLVRVMSGKAATLLATRLHEEASHALEVESRKNRSTIDTLFGIDWATLSRAALGDGCVASTRAGDRLHSEPLLDEHGRLVAVAMIVEPSAQGSRRTGVNRETRPATPLREGRRSRESAIGPKLARTSGDEARDRLSLEQALKDSAGCVREAAGRLGISESTVYRRMRRHGVDARTVPPKRARR